MNEPTLRRFIETCKSSEMALRMCKINSLLIDNERGIETLFPRAETLNINEMDQELYLVNLLGRKKYEERGCAERISGVLRLTLFEKFYGYKMMCDNERKNFGVDAINDGTITFKYYAIPYGFEKLMNYQMQWLNKANRDYVKNVVLLSVPASLCPYSINGAYGELCLPDNCIGLGTAFSVIDYDPMNEKILDEKV